MESIVWPALRRGWAAITITIVAGACAGYVCVDRLEPTFRSSVELLPSVQGEDAAKALATYIERGPDAESLQNTATQIVPDARVAAEVSVPAVIVAVESNTPDDLAAAATAVAEAIIEMDLQALRSDAQAHADAIEERLDQLSSDIDALGIYLDEANQILAIAESGLGDRGETLEPVAARSSVLDAEAEARRALLERDRLVSTQGTLRTQLEIQLVEVETPSAGMSVLANATPARQASIQNWTGAYLGALAGLMLAAGVVAIRELLVGPVRTRAEIEGLLGYRTIVAISPGGRVFARRDIKGLDPESTMGVLLPHGRSLNAAAVMAALRESALTEGTDGLRTVGTGNSEHVDSLLPVVALGRTRRGAVKRMARQISASAAPCVGVVEVHE